MSSRLLRCLLLWLLVMAVPPAFAAPVIVNANFGAVPITCGNDYAYQGTGGCDSPAQDFNSAPGFGWTLSTTHDQDYYGPGLTGPDTAFDPPPFDGLPFTQALFLQSGSAFGRPSASQDVDGFSAGSYTLSFYLGSRYRGDQYNGDQTVQALIDGTVIGTWALTSFTPFTQRFATFTVSTGGVHNLEFVGINDSGDHTAFLSGVDIAEGVPEPSTLVLLVTGLLGGVAKFYRR